MDEGIQHKDTYFVALKVFLEKNGRLLMLKDNFGDWDLPGGRIKTDEFETPLDKILARKMSEEVGSGVKYSIDKPEIFMRHQRQEHAPGNPVVRIFAMGYIAEFLSGEIELSPRHTAMEWVDVKTFQPESYFKGGWLKGVQEYLALKNRN